MFGDFDAARLSQVLAAIQLGVHYSLRNGIAQRLVDVTNALAPPALKGAGTGAYDPRLHQLKNRGIVELGPVLDRSQVDSLLAYFRSRPCFAAHVAGKSDGVGRTIEDCAARSHYGSYRIGDVLNAPFLAEIANREDILALAESYLGCPPTLYSVNAFWSFPEQTRPWPGIQTFHRDFDDFRFCTMFIFLTDFRSEDGAHYYIPGTHRPEVVEKIFAEKTTSWRREYAASPEKIPKVDLNALFAENLDLNAACAALFDGQIQMVTAPAGSAVIEDTYGLHKGDIPKSYRLLVWIRYGLYKNITNQRDNIVPLPAGALAGRIPDTLRHKYINRLLVAPG